MKTPTTHSPARAPSDGELATERIHKLSLIAATVREVYDFAPRRVQLIAFLRLVTAISPVAALWLWKVLLDAAVAFVQHRSSNTAVIWYVVTMELLLSVADDAARRTLTVLLTRLNTEYAASIGERLFLRTAHLDLPTFESPSFQDAMENARNHGSPVALADAAWSVLADVLHLACLTIFVVRFSLWLIPLLALSVLPLALADQYFASLAHSLSSGRAQDRRRLDYLYQLVSTPEPVKEVLAFNLAARIKMRFAMLSSRLNSETATNVTRRAIATGALACVSQVSYVLAYVAIIRQFLLSGATLGTFMLVARSFSRVRSAVERLAGNLGRVFAGADAVRGINICLSARPELPRVLNPTTFPKRLHSGVEFRDVTFRYPGTDRAVLNGISLSVSPGETVALIGENGAGKTTMVKLLARLYDPDTGGVYLDGVDIREYALEDLRARIGVVFQDFVRYNLTLRENISFGTVTDCSDDEIRDAAGRCGATALIDRSPAGLDQLVGRRFDGGMNLSRGEWQRLALSRAQLRHPSVLILDEPAASLDPRAEEEIVGPLCAPSRDRVTLLVSHRMSSLRFATHIAVLNGGIVAEHGHHRELMARGGVYAAFVKAQRAKHIVEWQPREIA